MRVKPPLATVLVFLWSLLASAAHAAEAASWPVDSVAAGPVVSTDGVLFVPDSGELIKRRFDGGTEVLHEFGAIGAWGDRYTSRYRSVSIKAAGDDVAAWRGEVLDAGSAYDLFSTGPDGTLVRGPAGCRSDDYDIDDGMVAALCESGLKVFRAGEGDGGVVATLDHPPPNPDGSVFRSMPRIAGRYLAYREGTHGERIDVVVYDWVDQREVHRADVAAKFTYEISELDVDDDGTVIAYIFDYDTGDERLVVVSAGSPVRELPFATHWFDVDGGRILASASNALFVSDLEGNARTVADFSAIELGLETPNAFDLDGEHVVWPEPICGEPLRIRVAHLTQTTLPVSRPSACPRGQLARRPDLPGMRRIVTSVGGVGSALSDHERYFILPAYGSLRVYDTVTGTFRTLVTDRCTLVAAALGRVLMECRRPDEKYWEVVELGSGHSFVLPVFASDACCLGSRWAQLTRDDALVFVNLETHETRAFKNTARNRLRDLNSAELARPPRRFDYYVRAGRNAIAVPSGSRTLLLLRRGRRDRILSHDVRPAYDYGSGPQLLAGHVLWTTNHAPPGVYSDTPMREMHAFDLATGRTFSWLWPNVANLEGGEWLGLMWVAGDEIFVGAITSYSHDELNGEEPETFDVYAAPWPPPKWRARAGPRRRHRDITVRFRAPEMTEGGPPDRRYYSVTAIAPRSGKGCKRRGRDNVNAETPGVIKAVLRLGDDSRWCKGRYRTVIRLRQRSPDANSRKVNRRIERFFFRMR